MKNKKSDQRRFLRITRPGTIALWQGRQAELLSSRDLGPGGVFIYSAEMAKTGKLLTLRIHLNESRGITVLAKVVRQAQPHEPQGYAVEFMDISFADRQILSKLVQPQAKAA